MHTPISLLPRQRGQSWLTPIEKLIRLISTQEFAAIAKEAQTKTTEKAPASKSPAQVSELGLEAELAPALPLPVGLHAIPPALRPRQVERMQRIQGNQAVQRAILQLATANRIQRAPGGGDTTPMPALPTPEERNAFAIMVLKKAYGDRIKADTPINAVADESALRAEYDRSMMAQGKTFKETAADGTVTERPWAAGDSSKHPDMRSSFSGFRDTQNNQIYVDKSKPPDEQTATIAHEMLHASSGGALLGAYGKGLDEGVTEMLTIDAFAKSGYSVASDTYTEWVTFARRLSTAFGGAVTDAYFGGLDALKNAIIERLGKGSFTRFTTAMQSGNMALVNDMIERGAMAVVEDLFSGWVSDDDIAAIKELYNELVEPERSKIRYYIQNNITSLMNEGQRAELRFLIGS